MKYQLVLQFRGDTLADFDEMVALEDELTRVLGNSAEVDGHDCGSGEINIFILTSDPAMSFWRIRQTLKQRGQLNSLMAAYRPVAGTEFKVIWPENTTERFSIK